MKITAFKPFNFGSLFPLNTRSELMKVSTLKTTLLVKSELKLSLGFLKLCAPSKMMMTINKTESMMPPPNVCKLSLKMTHMSSKL